MNRPHLVIAVSSTTCLLVLASSGSGQGVSFTGLGYLHDMPYPESEAWGISPDGSCVVGYSSDREPQGEDFGWTAFRWTRDEGMTGLGSLLGRPATHAYGASLQGRVVVGSATLGNGPESTRAFRWTAETGMVDLGTLGPAGTHDRSYALGVSADGGVVVGVSTSAQGFQAFRWSESESMVGLGDLAGGDFRSEATGVSADGSVIVGWSSVGTGCPTGSVSQSFRWTAGEGMVSLDSPSENSVATAVSADGRTIVGKRYRPGIDYALPYRWTAGTGMVELGSLPGGEYEIEPLAVSGDGSTVVGQLLAAPDGGLLRAFIWDARHGTRDLRTVLIEDYHLTEVEDWKLGGATSISMDGLTIAGFGLGPDGFQAWVAHLPEPGTALLVLTCAMMISPRPRRRPGGAAR